MSGPRPHPTVYDDAEQTVPGWVLDEALADVSHVPFWLDSAERPQAGPSLVGEQICDLAVVGGGFAGLWTALRAKERDPDRTVILLEGRRIAWAASGRNGGFAEPTLTHGRANGERHTPDELDILDELGQANLNDLIQTVHRYGIDCGLERVGTISIAVEPHQLAWLEADSPEQTVLRDRTAVRALVDSPIFLGGIIDPATVLVDPARLAWGLARVCKELGVEIYENSVVRSLRSDRDGLVLTTGSGRVLADQVALATNAFPALLRRTRWHTVPVYDYAIVTEPLTAEQKQALGWTARHGLADLSHRFHYIRLTPDDRILFGGYDAIYHFGRSMGAVHDLNDDVFARLTAHLLATFPQLGSIKVSHAWGGAIDTCNRFFAFYTRGFGGKVVQATGFTGLGVAATRFAADVMLDLLDGRPTIRTHLDVVQRSPLPFPPEPIAWFGVRATTAALARSDRTEGRRGLWLRLLDRLKLGFDS